MLRGNKGEWSETYAFLKLLFEGKLYAADSRLEKIETMYFPILKIIKEEIKGRVYEYLPGEKVEIYLNGERILQKDRIEFKNISEELFNTISKKMNNAIEIEGVEKFLNEIFCEKLSASSTEKQDIMMKIRDINTGYENKVGFSIKSQIGAPATLLNAGKSTNFIYKLSGDYTLDSVEKINSYINNQGGKDIKGKIRGIYESGKLTYLNTSNEKFANNLILIDSLMDKIIAQMLVYFYRDSVKSCVELVEKLEDENPLNFGNKYAYRYKMKKFLSAVALGMRPATEWNGIDEATGGYIIVTKKGEVLAYHIYNRNHFEDYLLENTKFETASTTRHKFGEVYEENGEFYIKLNLQIRFN